MKRRHESKVQLLHPALALLAAGVVLAALAGCGGGANEPTLTKAQVIEQGGAICKQAENGLKDLPKPTSNAAFVDLSPAEQQQGRIFLRGFASLIDSTREALGGLNAPEQDRDLLDGYVRDTGTVVEELKAAAAAPPRDVEAQANKAFALWDRASKQTAAYGFPKGVCGSR